MPQPVVSPAYQQILDWYQHFNAVQQAKPIPLLVTTGAPLEGADQPKETDPTTPMVDVFA